MSLAEPVRRRPGIAWSLALLITTLEIAGDASFGDVLKAFPFLLPIAAVTIIAFLAGRWAAAVAAIVSEPFLQYYVLPPGDSFALDWPTGYIGVAFYLSVCAIITSLMHGMFARQEALKESESSLRRLNDQLEQRVAERTADLTAAKQDLEDTNQNLETMVEERVSELKIANEEIQRFAYIVSHDLRAPLVNVLGFTSELDALRDDLSCFLAEVDKAAPTLVTADRRMAIETDLPEALGFIRTSTQKMDRLINAILKLSRDGRRKLNPEPIDVAALVEAQRETLSQQFSAKGAELHIDGQLPHLTSDRLAIEQIFGNLIENAVKYLSSKRPGRIVVSGRKDGSMLRYDVADNGRGIEAKDFERVFDLFRRAGEQDTQGEGIGLAYVRNLARRLGGNVTLQSEFDVGSTFIVTLPATFRAGPTDDMAVGARRLKRLSSPG